MNRVESGAYYTCGDRFSEVRFTIRHSAERKLTFALDRANFPVGWEQEVDWGDLQELYQMLHQALEDYDRTREDAPF